MTTIQDQEFGGERPLYASHALKLENVTIHPGESSIKESSSVEASHCVFEGKYVFWENRGIKVSDSNFRASARSSFWYSDGLDMKNCEIEAPKFFRRMKNIRLEGCRFTDAQETLWDCEHIRMKDISFANADYLGMHCADVVAENYRQDGNYSWQYARNVVIRNAVMNSKDALWEAENVTVYDSEINGEYLGWYAKNLHLVRCRLSGEQLLCYCDGLVLEDCSFSSDANLLFEYSTVEATISGDVSSIKNPTSGHIRICGGSLGQLLFDNNIKGPGARIEIC